jgi:hypothetical protein
VLQYKDFESFTSKERSLSSARNHTPASPPIPSSPARPSRHSSSSSSRKTRQLLPLIEVLSDGYITSKHIEMGRRKPPITIMILMTKIRGLMLMKDIKVDIPSDITKLRTFLKNCHDSIIELLYVFSEYNNDLFYGSINDRDNLHDVIKKLHEEIKADIELFNNVIPSLQKDDLKKNIDAFEDSLGKAWHSGSNINSLALSKSVEIDDDKYILKKLDPSRPQRKYGLADITDIQTQYFKDTTKIAYYVMMIDYISAEINSIYLKGLDTKTLQNRIKVKTEDDIYKEKLYGYL